MAFDDSNSPEYQKFKVDKLPKIVRFHTVDYKLLLAYYKHKYNKTVTPVQRRNGKSIPTKIKEAEELYSLESRIFLESTGIYHYPLFCYLRLV